MGKRLTVVLVLLAACPLGRTSAPLHALLRPTGVPRASPPEGSEVSAPSGLIRVLEPRIRALCPLTYAPDGKTLAIGGTRIRLCEPHTGKEKGRLGTGYGNTRFQSLALSPDGRLLAAGAGEESVRLYEVATGRLLWVADIAVDPVAFSPDGAVLATGGRGTDIWLWDVASGRELRCLRRGAKRPPIAFGLAFSPDGRKLAASGAPVTVWDVQTGARLRAFEGKAASVAFSPDGRLLAAAGGDPPAVGPFGEDDWRQALPVVYLWDAATGKERRRWKWDPWAGIGFEPFKPPPLDTPRGGRVVNVVAFSPDGKSLFAGGTDPAYLWEVATGRERLRFPGQGVSCCSVAFAPDGRTLAMSDGESGVGVWDLLTRSLPQKAKAGAPDPKELDRQWAALADEDAARAFGAVQSFAAFPGASLPDLRERVRPFAVESARMAELVRDLDHNAFPVREAATKELAALGELAEPVLRNVLDRQPTLEARRRIEPLLQRIEDGRLPPEQLRQLRAIEVLEHIGNAEARRVLENLAQGAPGFRLTREAWSSLERLGRRRTQDVAPSPAEGNL